MSSINKTTKKFNLVLLCTLFINPEIRSYGAEQNTDKMKLTSSMQCLNSNVIDLALTLYKHNFKNGIDIFNSPNIPLEAKTLWVAQAFGILKELTDLTRLIKSTHKLTLFVYQDSISPICGWNDKLKLFDLTEFYFHLVTDQESKKLTFSDIQGDNISEIMKLLLIKLTKKATFLESYARIKAEGYAPRKENSKERNTIIWDLYKSRYNIITKKRRITETIVNAISKNCESINPDNFKKIKLPYTDRGILPINDVNTTKKNHEIDSKMAESWETYVTDLNLMRTLPQNKITIMNKMAQKTLPEAMEGIKTDDLIELSSCLSNKNEILTHSYNTVLIISQNAVQERQKKKAFFNIEVTDTGRKLIQNLSVNTLDSKKNWILDACSLLKTFEDEINSNLFGTFFPPEANTYPFWNVNRGMFDQNENLLLGIPALSGKIIYISLNQFPESNIDRIIIPALLNQIIRQNQKCILWKIKENRPFNPSQLTKIIDPQECLFKIYDLNQNNIKLKRETEDYLDEYIKIKDIPIYSPHSDYPITIHLAKTPLGTLASITKLIQSICEYVEKFNYLLSETKLDNTSALKKENLPFFDKLYKDFITPILNEHTDDTIITTINFLNSQNELISQLNNTLILGLESEVKSSFPQHISTVNMTHKEKLRHRLEQRKRGDNTAPNKQKNEKENPRENIATSNKAEQFSLKQTKVPSQANPKKKKKTYKNTDHNIAIKAPPKPATLQLADDSIKLVPLNGGKLAVVAPQIPYIQERKPASQISEPKKVATPPKENRSEPIRPKMNSRALQKSTHQNQSQTLEKTTWSDVVEGIVPITKNTPSPKPMMMIAKDVETPPLIQQTPLAPFSHKETMIIPSAGEPEQKETPAVFEKKEVVPVLKNGTTFYEPKTITHDMSTESLESSPQRMATTPVIYNYLPPASNYTSDGLYVPYTFEPPEDAKRVVIQIALSENDKQGKKKNYGQGIEIISHVYHHYPQEIKHQGNEKK